MLQYWLSYVQVHMNLRILLSCETHNIVFVFVIILLLGGLSKNHCWKERRNQLFYIAGKILIQVYLIIDTILLRTNLNGSL